MGELESTKKANKGNMTYMRRQPMTKREAHKDKDVDVL
jgi:hypothetical protein